jgi:endonuclease YncB( thermonuclease family)
MLRNSNRIIKVLLFLSALLLSVSAQQQTITGKVVGVSDGDTITVLDADKRQHKIRLEGIDAPGSSQDYGSRAKQSLSDLVFGKTVTVTSSKRDRYGRVLGKVTLDVGKLPLEGRNVNLEQVRRGYAWFYRHYAKELRPEDAAAYERAENDAKASKRGMWANGEPMPP